MMNVKIFVPFNSDELTFISKKLSKKAAAAILSDIMKTENNNIFVSCDYINKNHSMNLLRYSFQILNRKQPISQGGRAA